ncbi:MAG: hypothetical protein RLZZ507_4161 [Cyanobacteriota bacterium]
MMNINRRMFLNLMVSGVAVYLTKDLIFPEIASANDDSFKEKYHVFIPYEIARRGGIQKVTLRSGDSYKLTIPPRIIEYNTISIPKIGLQGNDVKFILHTLYDPNVRIADKIYQEIDQADFLRKYATKTQVKQIYELVEDSEYIEDTISLDLLQYLVASSNLDEQIRQRYEIAHQNCLLNIIEKAIETALTKSELSKDEKKRIRGTYQYVISSEPVPDFSYLEDLEAIIAGSDIPISIKNIYSLASAKSRAFTVDVIIVQLIQDNQYLSPQNKENYLRTYKEIRAGEKISDPNTLQLLNLFILGSNISYSSKVVYLMAQNIFLQKDAESAKENFGGVKNVANFVTKAGINILPAGQGVLTVLGAETATGVAISSLSGGAATTATLVYLGGGSVAAGGLGMLGGLAVVTGGAALIGAAGLVSVALVSQMDAEDYKNLGIATATGTLTGAGAVLIAWTAASMLEVAGTLSGAAAITTIISALGGISVITGGASLIAFGAGFVVWSFLKGQKHRDANILHQLESRLYTLTEIPDDPNLKDFRGFLNQELNNSSEIEGFFIAPNIPIDKLSNAISSYADSLLEADEKILAMKNTGFWNDGKEGIILTNKKLIWKNGWSEPESLAFSAISGSLTLPEDNIYFYRLMRTIGEIYRNL